MRLWPYLKTFIIISFGIIVIVTGMYWGVRTWGMRNVHVDIDWGEFINFNDITYLISSQPVAISTENLTYYDNIRFRLSGNVNNPNYRSKNGDAAFLDVGTPVYSVNGYSPKFRLWADGYIYEADTNPKARTGTELLDIEGKVEYIGVGKDTEMKIKKLEKVAELVEMVLAAPVKQNITFKEYPVFIRLYLKDGTVVCRAFQPEQGQLYRGIMLPKEFWDKLLTGDEVNP